MTRGPSLASPALLAHQVQLSGEIGGTLHVEPNDNPKTGENTLAWFALVRKGGQPLPLEDCDCQLLVYLNPREADASPILTPDLTPISAEGFVNIPSAEMVFPTVGAYELVMVGKPADSESFEPFELNFEVLVTAGKNSPELAETNAPDSKNDLSEPLSSEPLTEEATGAERINTNGDVAKGDKLPISATMALAIAIAAGTVVGLIYAWVRLRKR